MSDTLRAAAQQALEALRAGVRAINHLGGAKEAVPLHDAIDALRVALAAAVAEPLTDGEKSLLWVRLFGPHVKPQHRLPRTYVSRDGFDAIVRAIERAHGIAPASAPKEAP